MSDWPEPYWNAPKDCARLYLGNVIDVLRSLPAQSVHCAITSPPYFGLRDYGTGQWEGGDPKCDHVKNKQPQSLAKLADSYAPRKNPRNPNRQDDDRINTIHYKDVCGKCGAKRIDLQLGAEPLHDCGTLGKADCKQCFVCNLTAVFREVHRVLRDDGSLWLNLGDSYSSGGRVGNGTREGYKQQTNRGMNGSQDPERVDCGLPSGNLVGIPWRVAFALQANGWILRQDIIWCLSGGAWVYARTQKGEMPVMVKDLVRLDPTTVKLWNGEKWTQVLGWGQNPSPDTPLELVLRSGERIGCTGEHLWPTQRGLVKAFDLKVGDVLDSCQLPEPEDAERPPYLINDMLWLVGLFLAEGNFGHNGPVLSLHADELKWFPRISATARHYGGTASYNVHGNCLHVRIFGKVLEAILRTYVGGSVALDKYLKVATWKLPNHDLRRIMNGYLDGDGHADPHNPRFRLGFCRNYSLERDLRVMAARLGATITLKPMIATNQTGKHPAFRGEWKWQTSGHHNEKNRAEILEIRFSRARKFWDISVADEPHTFALSSGILTHNCKPSPMPESVDSRCTKSHEYIFLFVKKMGYFYDAEAIKEKAKYGYGVPANGDAGMYGRVREADPKDKRENARGSKNTHNIPSAGRKKRSVWSVVGQGYPGAHFATFPPKLVEPMVLAGSSKKGCCSKCGAPCQRILETKKLKRQRPNVLTKRSGEEGTGNYCPNTVAGVESRTIGWEPTCKCKDAGIVPCVILDPFCGSATTGEVALEQGRHFVGIDLSKEYLDDCAIPRLKKTIRKLQSSFAWKW